MEAEDPDSSVKKEALAHFSARSRTCKHNSCFDTTLLVTTAKSHPRGEFLLVGTLGKFTVDKNLKRASPLPIVFYFYFSLANTLLEEFLRLVLLLSII